MLIGICEDDPFFRQELRHKIAAQPQPLGQIAIMEFASGEEMLASSAPFDLVFLDIELGAEQNGLALASALLKRLPDVILVFVTSHTEYIATALHLPTFQFLLKPVDDALFAEEFARCLERYRCDHDTLAVQKDGQALELAMQDILYLTTNKRKMQIYDRRGEVYERYGKLSDWEEHLRVHYFIRIHKSYIVNCRYIKKLQSTAALLRQPQEAPITLPVSRRYKDAAQAAYQHYVLEVRNK